LRFKVPHIFSWEWHAIKKKNNNNYLKKSKLIWESWSTLKMNLWLFGL
jgi:hypothetical protein